MPIEEIRPEDFEPAQPKPKRVAPKRAAAPRRTSTRNLTTEISGVLMTGNLFLAPVLRADMMDEIEITALAKAIDDQARKSPRFRRMVEAAISTAGGASLLTVVAMIAGRRMARHGMIDKQWDENLKGFLMVASIDVDPSQLQDLATQLFPEEPHAAQPESTDGAAPAQ